MPKADLDAFLHDLPAEQWIDRVMTHLRQEPPEAVRARAATAFDRVAGPTGRGLLLFGAGWLGRFVLRGLRQVGIEPIAFVDNRATAWGTTVDGLPVISPTDAATAHAATTCLVVTVYHGSVVAAQVEALGFHRIARAWMLFWRYPEVFIPSSCMDLPHRLLEQEGAIRAGYAVLADDPSRREFCAQLLWRFDPTTITLPPHAPAADTYFPDDLVRPVDDEVFVDCGAFDGDSARAFLQHRQGQFGRLVLLEPDARNRAALTRWTETLPLDQRARITVLPYGASDVDARVAFHATHDAGSTLIGTGGDAAVEVRRLDTLLAGEVPSYLKMDIEGAEPLALAGAAATLRAHHPVVAVCLYHRSEHLWEIPTLLHRIAPDYRLVIRRYAEECWELVGYAVPATRWAPGAAGAAPSPGGS